MDMQGKEPAPITSDDLFVGLALPPTLFGAPFGYTLLVIVISLGSFIAAGNPIMILIGLPLMFLGRLLIATDPYAIGIWNQRMILRQRLHRSAINWTEHHLVVSVSPADYRKGKCPKKDIFR